MLAGGAGGQRAVGIRRLAPTAGDASCAFKSGEYVSVAPLFLAATWRPLPLDPAAALQYHTNAAIYHLSVGDRNSTAAFSRALVATAASGCVSGAGVHTATAKARTSSVVRVPGGCRVSGPRPG